MLLPRALRQFLPRADSVIALTIPVVGAAVLLEAYFRTEYGDAESPEMCRCAETDELIHKDHVKELQKTGIVIVPNFLSSLELERARFDIQKLQESTSFQETANDADVRQDKIVWITESPGQRSAHTDVSSQRALQYRDTTGLQNCVRRLRGIPSALQKHSYASSYTYKVPRQCQLALYPGDGQAEYQRHLDQCDASFTDLGLLEWWRLSDYRERCITTILYLNQPQRPPSEGGSLRCWLPTEKTDNDYNATSSTGKALVEEREFDAPFDVHPLGGTLIIFQSKEVEHQVLPSTTDRFALTNWVAGHG